MEGWIASAAFIALMFTTVAVWHKTTPSIIALMVLIVAYFGVIVLTGDPPGRAGSRR